MRNEQVVLVRPDAARLPVDVADADVAFRARLERSLAAGYRLAPVILGDPGDAEDATHDAVERAWRARAGLRDLDRFEAWFQRIVINACRDRIRRRRSTPRFVSVGEGTSPSLSQTLRAAGDAFAESAERDAVRRALAQINIDQRVVIAMRYYLDLEIDEIARRLGTRSGTVKSRLHRGLRTLRAAWESER